MIYSNFAYDVMFEFRMIKGCSRALEWSNSKALGYSILFYYTLPSNLDLDLDGFVVCTRSGEMAELQLISVKYSGLAASFICMHQEYNIRTSLLSNNFETKIVFYVLWLSRETTLGVFDTAFYCITPHHTAIGESRTAWHCYISEDNLCLFVCLCIFEGGDLGASERIMALPSCC